MKDLIERLQRYTRIDSIVTDYVVALSYALIDSADLEEMELLGNMIEDEIKWANKILGEIDLVLGELKGRADK